MAYDARLLARHPELLAERHNYTATADPTVNDDENDYYGVGSVWVNRLTNTVFICCDPTNGAAVWSEVGATEAVESVIDPTANDDIDAGYPTGTTWINQTTNSFFISVDSTAGAAIWNEVPHHNFNGAAAPTANDDVTAGYDVGSTWIYGTTLYTCVIATAAAAVWIEVNTSHNAAVDPTANDDINDGFVRGSTWINTTNSTIWHCIDNSAGAAVWQQVVKVHSTNEDPTVNDDIDQGYIPGSTWVNTANNAVYICVDNTAGNAIWVQQGPIHYTGSDPTVNDDIDAGYTVGTTWTNTATGSVFVCTDNTDGAAVWAEQAATTSTIQKATATIPYNDADGKVTLLTMTANGFIRFVGKVVTTAYDAGTVTVGEEGDEANLMTAELVDAQGATHDTYTPNKYYASGSVIKAFITPGPATEGTFTLIIEYVTV
ncbi:MAG: hypothetical protein WDA41_09355 [Candidatus Neomarinimicrobiota bacterium]